jgi:hypothetical protein
MGIAGCDRQPAAPQAVPSAAIPAGLLLSEAPAGAKDVAAVVKEAKNGDEVVVRGRIGGRAEPFVGDRAVVQIIDPAIKACSENPGDGCTTPWDVCCEPTDRLLAGSLLVQVLDADGRPLKAGLKGVGGLQPLSTIIVKGKAARPEGSKAVTVNATSLHVVKP